MSKTSEQIILGMSYTYFAGKRVTPEEIEEFIKRAIDFYSEVSIDKQWLFRNLHSIHMVPYGSN